MKNLRVRLTTSLGVVQSSLFSEDDLDVSNIIIDVLRGGEGVPSS